MKDKNADWSLEERVEQEAETENSRKEHRFVVNISDNLILYVISDGKTNSVVLDTTSKDDILQLPLTSWNPYSCIELANIIELFDLGYVSTDFYERIHGDMVYAPTRLEIKGKKNTFFWDPGNDHDPFKDVPAILERLGADLSECHLGTWQLIYFNDFSNMFPGYSGDEIMQYLSAAQRDIEIKRSWLPDIGRKKDESLRKQARILSFLPLYNKYKEIYAEELIEKKLGFRILREYSERYIRHLERYEKEIGRYSENLAERIRDIIGLYEEIHSKSARISSQFDIWGEYARRVYKAQGICHSSPKAIQTISELLGVEKHMEDDYVWKPEE